MKTVLKLIIICLMLSSCSALSKLFLPSRAQCQQLYPEQFKDSTTIKKDSIKVPFYVYIKGDTTSVFGKVNKPCPDSITAWDLFTMQLNTILNEAKGKYKQELDFKNNVFTSKLMVANDSILYWKNLYFIEKTNTKSVLTPVPYPQTPKWVWWVVGIFALIVGGGIFSVYIKFIK